MEPGNRPHDLVGADVPQFRPVPRSGRRADRSRRPRSVSRELLLAPAHPEDRARVASLLEEYSGQAGPLRIEYRIMRPDGAVHWIVLLGNVTLGENGSPAAMLGISIDSTRRREVVETAEAALRDRERRLRELNEDLGAARRPAHQAARRQPRPDPGDLRQLSGLAEPVPRHRRRKICLRGPQHGDRARLRFVARTGGRPPGSRKFSGSSRRSSRSACSGNASAPARTSATRRAARWPA